MPASSQVIIFQKKGSRLEGNFFMYIIAAWYKKSEDFSLFHVWTRNMHALSARPSISSRRTLF